MAAVRRHFSCDDGRHTPGWVEIRAASDFPGHELARGHLQPLAGRQSQSRAQQKEDVRSLWPGCGCVTPAETSEESRPTMPPVMVLTFTWTLNLQVPESRSLYRCLPPVPPRSHWKDAPPPESWGEEKTQDKSEVDAGAVCK